MSVEARFAALLDRLAVATNVRRTRVEDAGRDARHGARAAGLARMVGRVESLLAKVDVRP